MAEKLTLQSEVEQLATDERFMKLALQQAEEAGEIDEVPVGAIVVSNELLSLGGTIYVRGLGISLPMLKCRYLPALLDL